MQMAFAKENHLNATQNYLNDNPGGCFNLQKKISHLWNWMLTDDGLSLSHRNLNQLKVTLQINESMNRMHKLWPSLNLPNHLLDQLVDQVVDHLVDQLVDQPAWMPHGHNSHHHHHHQHECPMVSVQVTIRQADWPTLQRKFGSYWQQSPFNVCSCSVSRKINASTM